MCSVNGETKSATDVKLSELLDEIKSKELVTENDQQLLLSCLSKFEAIWIIKRTEEDNYNLVHDFFAPLIRLATEGLETNVEKANRLLSRYVADFRQDQKKTFIPLRHISLIRKFGSKELLSDAATRKLLSQSYVRAAVPMGLPALIIIGPLAVCYGILWNSWYIDTNEATYKYGAPAIVVRFGHPDLRFMPGFDQVRADLGFDMNDIEASNSRAKDELPKRAIWGFISGDADIRAVAERIAPLRRAELYRLIGDIPSAETAVQGYLKSRVTFSSEPALRLGLIAKADSKRVTPEILAALRMDAATQTPYPQFIRISANLSLLELSQDLPDMRQAINLSVDEAIRLLDRILKTEEYAHWQSGYLVDTLARLAISPNAFKEPEIDLYFAMLRDAKNNSWARSRAIPLLEAIAAGNETGAGGVFKRLLHLIVNDRIGEMPDGGWWLKYDARETAARLACRKKGIVSTDTVSPLLPILAQNPLSQDAVMDFSVLASVIAQANPSVIPGGYVEVLKRYREDSKNAEQSRWVAAIALTRFGAADPRWSDKDALDQTFRLLAGTGFSSDEAKTVDLVKHSAASAIADLTGSQALSIEQRTAVLEQLGTLIQREGSARKSSSEERDLALILGRLWNEQIAGSETIVRNIINAIIKPAFSGGDFDAVDLLTAAARHAPQEVLSHAATLYDKQSTSIGEDITGQFHARALGALARAHYQQDRKSSRPALLEMCLEKMRAHLNYEQRLFGMYGVFLLSIDEPERIANLKETLKGWLPGKSAPERMAATGALEMLWVAEQVHKARLDRSKFDSTVALLRLYEHHPEHHIRFSARVGLEALDQVH